MVWRNDQVNEAETKRILSLAKECLGVEGDFVEMGCYKGDTSLLLAEIIQNDAHSVKKLWIYDSFEGLPEKGGEDESVMGVDFKKGELLVTKREVKVRFLKAGLPVPVIKKAWFADLTVDDMPRQIAFAFLDGDFYQSIKDSLELVGPLMNDDGIVVIHDYSNPALPGVRQAVDEWTLRHKAKFQMVLL